MMNAITSKGSKELEMEVKYLYDEVVTLKTAIEEAIIKGQKSSALVSDIPECGVVCDEDFALTCRDAWPGVVGWIDDL
jgi:hypothetical protein